MKRQYLLAAFAAAAVGVPAVSPADGVDEIKYRSEVRSCVDEIRGRIDFGDASRVRHDVILVKEKLVGYAMRIDTAIYTDPDGPAVREYATYCVVNGDHKPLKFEIEPQTGDRG
jgi:hypothetical protein